MNIYIKHIERSAYIWMYSAIVIFMLGFVKWFIAVPVVAAVVFAVVTAFKKQSDEHIRVSKGTLIIGAIIILIWMAFCGQGGFFDQGMDWNGRNAQLADLVNYSWPVYYSDGSAFTYYIGHFLPPALFGKLSGLGGARAFFMFYTSLGVYIVWLLMIKILRTESPTKQLFVLTLFVFFGSTEDLRNIMLNFLSGLFHTELTGAVQYGFTTNFNLYAWAFNQVTCSFIVLALFFSDDRRVENYIFMGVPLILFSPIMMCTTIVIFICGAVREFVRKDNFIKRLFSIQNLCVLVFVVPVIIMYLSGNVFSEKPDSVSFHVVKYNGQWAAYFLFLLFEFVFMSLLMYPRFKKNVYFYAANAILIILPFFKMGLYNDLVTRGSAPALFILMLCAGDYLLNEHNAASKRVRKTAICLLLLTVAIPCANRCFDAVKDMSQEIAAGKYHKKWLNDWQTYEKIWERQSGDDQKYNYFTFDAKEHFFFKYMSRK